MADVQTKTTKASTMKITTYDMVYVAFCVAFIAVCAWMTIPYTVPFTMQTFAIFFAVACFGALRGTCAVVIYLLLGMIGVPVFAGMKGGMDVLFGVTGGYLIGFVFAALIAGLLIKWLGRSYPAMIVSMFLGMAAYYFFGTIWFVLLYTKNTAKIGFGVALLKCVVPYLLPDAIKSILAIILAKQMRKLGLLKR